MVDGGRKAQGAKRWAQGERGDEGDETPPQKQDY